MTKIKLFTAILAFSLLTACSSDPLIGKWSLVDLNYDALLKTMPAEQQAMAKQQIAAGKKEIQGKVVFEILADGKINSTQPSPADPTKSETKKGTWKMGKDKKSFTLKLDGQEKASDLKIVKNTAKELVLEEIAPAGAQTGPTPQLIFEKK